MGKQKDGDGETKEIKGEYTVLHPSSFAPPASPCWPPVPSVHTVVPFSTLHVDHLLITPPPTLPLIIVSLIDPCIVVVRYHTGKFDLHKVQYVRPTGHCVVVQVNPDDGFKPTGGRVEELNFKSKPNVWAYFTVKSLQEQFMSFLILSLVMFFAFGESRLLAIANMVLGLEEIQIRGDIRTNVDYTVDLECRRILRK